MQRRLEFVPVPPTSSTRRSHPSPIAILSLACSLPCRLRLTPAAARRSRRRGRCCRRHRHSWRRRLSRHVVNWSRWRSDSMHDHRGQHAAHADVLFAHGREQLAPGRGSRIASMAMRSSRRFSSTGRVVVQVGRDDQERPRLLGTQEVGQLLGESLTLLQVAVPDHDADDGGWRARAVRAAASALRSHARPCARRRPAAVRGWRRPTAAPVPGSERTSCPGMAQVSCGATAQGVPSRVVLGGQDDHALGNLDLLEHAGRDLARVAQAGVRNHHGRAALLASTSGVAAINSSTSASSAAGCSG